MKTLINAAEVAGGVAGALILFAIFYDKVLLRLRDRTLRKTEERLNQPPTVPATLTNSTGSSGSGSTASL